MIAWLYIDHLSRDEDLKDEYTYSAGAGALIEAYKKLQVKDHEACSRIGGYICERAALCNDTQISQFAADLFNETQRLKNSGSGNPDAYRLLRELANKNDRAVNLFEHAFDPDGV